MKRFKFCPAKTFKAPFTLQAAREAWRRLSLLARKIFEPSCAKHFYHAKNNPWKRKGISKFQTQANTG